MDPDDPSTQLMFTTVPVHAHMDGDDQIATGFFYSVQAEEGEGMIPLLLTNKHVVDGANAISLSLTAADSEGNPTNEALQIRINDDRLEAFQPEKLDLTGFPIGDILNRLTSEGHNPFFKSVTQDLIPAGEDIQGLSAIEDVTFIGYPSGLMDKENLSPIARRGITATPPWNNYEGEPALLIDAGVYPGSSGSPVFIFNQGSYASSDGALVAGNRLIFLGVLSQTMMEGGNPGNRAYLGLGKVIRSDAVSKYTKAVSDQLKSEIQP